MLVECVEDYSRVNQPNLKYTCDGGALFNKKITGTGKYQSYTYNNSLAWPEDWWTAEASGYDNYYPPYHAYKQDYAVFLGHGKEGAFVFGVIHYAANGYGYSEAWLITPGPNGYSWIYPHDDYDGIYTRWITLYACDVLNNDDYPQGYSVFDVFYYTFNDQGRSPVYLHGIVSARTDLVDGYKPCFLCGEVDVVSNTMKDYANRLISGASITDAWFNAVWTQNVERGILGNIVFQAHPAALYYIVQFKDANGNILESVDYKTEGMLGFSTMIYPAPSQLPAPPGTASIVYIEFYLTG